MTVHLRCAGASSGAGETGLLLVSMVQEVCGWVRKRPFFISIGLLDAGDPEIPRVYR